MKFIERPATLHTDGWGGRQRQSCVVVGETPQRYRVRPEAGTELRFPMRGAGVRQILGGTVLVPKYAITFSAPTQKDKT